MIENYSNDIIQSFEYETSINSDGNILGTCELGIATIQMINDSNIYSSLKGQWIKTIHGSFYIYDVEPVQEKVNIKLSCYDVKYKLDTKYDKSLYTFPMTLKEWRNAIFTSCGVEYDDTDFPNSDLSLSAEPYVGDNPSNRQVISLIAQAGASFVITDENDKFYFKWFNNINHNITDWLELTTEKENTPAINVVVLGRGNVEDNVCYPDPLPENKVGLRIDNNYIIDPQIESNDIRYTTRVPIYNQVNGFSFIPFSIRTQEVNNKLSINIGDKASYKDIWGNNLTSYVMTKKNTYLGGNPTDDDNYEITLSAEELNETSTEYSYASSIENRVSKVEITTDKQNKKINALVEEVDENTEKVSNLSLEVDKINSSVSSINNQIIPTSIVSGEKIHIEDGSDNDMISLKLDGRSKQDTRSGKNLLYWTRPTFGTIVENEDGSFTWSYPYAHNLSMELTGELEAGTYTISNYGDITLFLQKSNNDYTISISSNGSKIFTYDGASYLRLLYSATTLNTPQLFKLQIEQGSSATDYEAYGVSPSPEYPSEIESVGKYNEDTRKYEIEIEVVNTGEGKSTLSSFVLNEPLRSLPNGTKDELIVENGIVKKIKKIGKKVFDGSENWYLSLTNDNTNMYYIQLEHISEILMSNYFTQNSNLYNDDIEGIRGNASNNRLWIRSKLKTIDEFKSWLSENNTEVIYELENEEVIEIGEIEQPRTYQGVNNISNSAETNMTIEYVRDTILSDYVEGQIGNAIIIQERKNAEFQITNEEIKSSVSNISTDLDGTKSSLNSVEEKITSQEKTINIISKNIDGTTGDIREVTTTAGFTFNAEGLTIDDGAGYKAQHAAQGTFYKDGDSITGQYTKDGSKQKDLELFGTYSYGKNDINDTPMFVAQLYTDEKGEECFGHFYNGGDY